MLNYMKSECYRTLHGKGFYMAIGLLGGMVLCMNVILALSQHYLEGFLYGTFRFSLNMYTGAIFWMIVLGAVVPACLFWDDRRNGVMKNAIAYGIAREKMFLGKCIVAFGFTALVLCAVLAVYISSAYLLLANPEWEPLREMLMGVCACLPSAMASLVFSIMLGCICQKEMTSVLVWVIVYYLIPMGFFLAGLKFDIFARISRWMPYGFLTTEAIVYMNRYDCLWDTAAGFAKCMVSGAVGMAVFLIAGIWKFRKQEL